MFSQCPLTDSLPAEHRALCRAYASVQARCSRLIAQQQAEIEQLQAQVVQLRAAAIVQRSALAFAREDQTLLERSIVGVPRRAALVRHVEFLAGRVQALLRERLHWQWFGVQPQRTEEAPAPLPPDGPHTAPVPGNLALLEASMAAADLVICQTGCLSHGAYWRDHEHCRRTGKPCVLADAPATTHLMVKKASSPLQSSADSYQKV